VTPPLPQGSTTEEPHLFVSYAAEDREVARLVAEALTARGHRVWWDRLIAGGELWSEEIERALAEARAVIVLWSPSSVRSNFVRAEARSAAERDVLIPALIEPCEPPMPFGEFQTLDLIAWRSAPDGGTLDVLHDAIEQAGRTEPLEGAPTAARTGTGVPARASRITALLGYWVDLFQLATGPKAFLSRKWNSVDLVASAGRFFVMTAVLKLLIGLPLALKLGSRVSWELLGAFVWGPIRMLMLGAVVHVAWRVVGGSAAATNTLSAFAFVYSLQTLLFECSQSLSVGLMRALAPAVTDEIFSDMSAGRGLGSLFRAVEEYGVAVGTVFLTLAWWPLFVVPFLSWGAFRVHNNVSRTKSAIAATFAVIFGMLAYGMSVFLTYSNAGPG
jgi:hypothetical protein